MGTVHGYGTHTWVRYSPYTHHCTQVATDLATFFENIPFETYYLTEGSLEVKLPTILANEKQRWEESEKRRQEERRSKKRKSEKKEDPGARKVGKPRNIVLFQ